MNSIAKNILISFLLFALATGCASVSSSDYATPKPTVFRGSDYFAFQTDTVRTYLPDVFANSVLQSSGPHGAYTGLSKNDTTLFQVLSSGKLTGEMFCRALQEPKTEVLAYRGGQSIHAIFRDSVWNDIKSFSGPIVVLQWASKSVNSDTADYSLCVSLNREEIGGHCILFYLTIIRNRIASFGTAGGWII